MPMRMVESAHDLLDQRFEILAEAGSGGMGTVYKAVDARTGALAAVKVLRKDRERPDGVSDAERFRREASLLAELRHPGIVSYLGSGESKHGQLYLAMEWLDGEDLASRPSVVCWESRRVCGCFGVSRLRSRLRIHEGSCIAISSRAICFCGKGVWMMRCFSILALRV